MKIRDFLVTRITCDVDTTSGAVVAIKTYEACNMITGKLSPANSNNLINVTLRAGGEKSKATALAFSPSCTHHLKEAM
jgi:hypothetical protein